jgi:hypothetical protein
MQEMHSIFVKCWVLQHTDLILQAVVQAKKSAMSVVVSSGWTALEDCTVLPCKICTAV